MRIPTDAYARRKLRRSAAVAGAALLVSVLATSAPQPARAVPPVLPITVTNTADSGAGSLRQAILTANSSAGRDTIVFATGAAGPQVIAPLTDLPTITDTVTIDGYTQPGAAPATANANAVMVMVIDATGLSRGLDIVADGCTVKGLVVQNADTGNGTGIRVTGTDNVISGNYLGTTANGLQAAGNFGLGVDVLGDGNVIGGSSPRDRNVISANDGGGVMVVGNDNTIAGNRIGTNASGITALGNSSRGIEVRGDANMVGGLKAGDGNLVSANTSVGVVVSAGRGNRVLGNRIGTDVNGIAARGNRDGVTVQADGTEVSGNLISGNQGDGLSVEAKATVLRNRIGTTAAGTAALPNGQDGIIVRAAGAVIGMPGNGNLVSANADDGVSIDLAAGPGVTVRANMIGVSSAGAPLGNDGDGVSVHADGVLVGGATPPDGNVISANGDRGVAVYGDNARLEGNTVGTRTGGAALGNGMDGIEIFGDGSQIVRNTIGNNNGVGIQVTTGSGNALLDNTIDANLQLGIDLGAAGATPNDPADTDAGANDLLNHPTVVGVSTVNGTTTVAWKIDQGLPSSIQLLDFYHQAQCDPSGHGESVHHFASTTVLTDPSGQASGQLTATATAPVGNAVSATATLQIQAAPPTFGSTSEFSACTTVT
ncbi:right-handed parallel beta-helix repeat-containing protein [Streptomycetaceae bacterium NBC_01309]